MRPEAHILVVDDEPRYLSIIRFNLEAGGFQVTCTATGEEALALFTQLRPNLVLLDIMLPGIDGFEVLQRIHEISEEPIVMLTAKGAEDDKVKGLRLGADDYITKPFSAQELTARVEAVLRRTRSLETDTGRGSPLWAGDLHIDAKAKRVTVANQEVRLSPTEYRLLACLAASPGVVLSHEHLLERVWGSSYQHEHDILRIALWRLRRKLERDPSNPQFIITRPGMGYMLAVPR